MSESFELKKARQAEREILKGRFCTSCRQIKPTHFGEFVKSKKTTPRWRCSSCAINSKRKPEPKKG